MENKTYKSIREQRTGRDNKVLDAAFVRMADALTKLAVSQATNTELLLRLAAKMEPLMDKALISADRDLSR